MTERWIVDDAGTLIDIVTRDTFDYVSEVAGVLNDYEKENKKLKQVNEMLQMDFAMTERNLIEENEQLKQRNDRQAKQLDRLYNLIEEKDWRALSDILDDFKRCEEQLQKEWGTYGDIND